MTLAPPQALHTKVPSSFPALIHAPLREIGAPVQLQLLSFLGDRQVDNYSTALVALCDWETRTKLVGR